MKIFERAGHSVIALVCCGWLVGLTPSASLAEASVPVAALPDGATVDRDQKTVRDLLAAAQSGGFALIGSRLQELQAIMDRAPTPFHRIEEIKSTTFVREVNVENCLASITRVAGARAKDAVSSGNVICVANPYPVAALLVGSYDNEAGLHNEAIAVLERGQTWDPTFVLLAAEKGAAFNELHRFQDGYDSYSAGLKAAGPLARALDKGIALRGEGFSLTELKRYNEAEAAYRESLKFDQTHGHAKEELVYIERMRAGEAPTSTYSKAIIPSLPPK